MIASRLAGHVLLLAVGALVLLPAQGAAADEPVVVTFDAPSVQLEYGQYWNLTARATNTYAVAAWTATGAISGPGSPSLTVYSYTNTSNSTTAVSLSQDGADALDAGTYTVSTTVSSDGSTESGTATATITVKPAPLGVETRMTADPAAPGNIILSARLTGNYIDGLAPYENPTAPLAPAGTWKIVVKDSTGATATEQTAQREAGGTVYAFTSYWSEAKPGEQYTAVAAFTPSDQDAGNFTVSASAPFDVTVSNDERPVPTSTATPSAPTDESTEAGGTGAIAIPTWVALLSGVLAAALGALVVVLAVRLRRHPVPAPAMEVEG